jgi:hypothetical protein
MKSKMMKTVAITRKTITDARDVIAEVNRVLAKKYRNNEATRARVYDNAADCDSRLRPAWVEEPDGSHALVIDAKTWAAYEQAANARGKTARQIITAAAAEALVAILMDNNVPNRSKRADAPDFLPLNRELKVTPRPRPRSR